MTSTALPTNAATATRFVKNLLAEAGLSGLTVNHGGTLVTSNATDNADVEGELVAAQLHLQVAGLDSELTEVTSTKTGRNVSFLTVSK